MSKRAVRPSCRVEASAAGSLALPMLLASKLAVPEGNTSSGRCRSRMAYATRATVPSPPEATTASKSAASRASCTTSSAEDVARMTSSSSGRSAERANENMSSTWGPEAGL